jgi:ATP-dependent protease ClpP protease subunit
MEQLFEIELPKDRTNVFDNYVPIVRSASGRLTHVYLTEAVEVPSTYNELCFTLDNAEAGDTIHIHINNPGGYISSANMLYYSIVHSKARIIGHLSGDVASAATVLTMACDDIVVNPFTQFMIHNYSGGVAGKGKEAKDQMDFVNNEINESFREYYRDFLTEEEISDVIDDHDIWLNSREVEERWKKKLTTVCKTI